MTMFLFNVPYFFSRINSLFFYLLFHYYQHAVYLWEFPILRKLIHLLYIALQSQTYFSASFPCKISDVIHTDMSLLLQFLFVFNSSLLSFYFYISLNLLPFKLCVFQILQIALQLYLSVTGVNLRTFKVDHFLKHLSHLATFIYLYSFS